ncbi:MAG: SPASM domain-containing protein [Clostridia bacterium]
MMRGYPPESCGMAGHCNMQHVVEADGSVYPCDFYVLDAYRLGNLCTDDFPQLYARLRETGFLEQSLQADAQCAACPWRMLCRGGCRRDRETASGTLARNAFCTSYAAFFEYATPRLAWLAQHA